MMPALAEMSTTERLARRVLSLIDTPVMRPPSDRAELSVWWAAAFEREHSLSTGERTLFLLALAVYNGDPALPASQLRLLDPGLRAAVAPILVEWLIGDGQ